MNNNTLTPDEIKYQEALKRVKKIKGFQSHLLVYLVVNTMLVVLQYNNLDAGENFWSWRTFNMAFFWGTGVLAHALSVFIPTILVGKNWEERKIKELMEKEKQNKWE